MAGMQVKMGSLLLICAVGVGGLAAGCAKAAKSPPASASVPKADVISIFTLVGHSETGRKKWEVQGQTADLGAQTVVLSPVTAVSYGNVTIHLTAKTGHFNRTTQDVHLEEDVVAVTSDGARLTTDTFDWAAERQMGTTADWVTVTRTGMVVTGHGGISFPNLKRVRLKKDVTVALEGSSGRTVISCDGPMDVDYGRSKARFLRNVKVRDARGVITSDRMDIELDPQTKQMREATFWGHVVIIHEKQVAHSNRAKYWQLSGRTLLVGHPKVVMPGNQGLLLGE